MGRNLILMAVILVCLGMMLSGSQAVTGYYSDPSGYGFYHLSYGYLYMTVSFLVLAGMLVFFAVRKLGDRLF
jgi:hypothetical protein